MNSESRSLTALALLNSSSPFYLDGRERVLMYLDHFGVPIEVVDLLTQTLPPGLDQFPLIIAAHAGIQAGACASAVLRDALRAGTGFLSFDPELSGFFCEQTTGGAESFFGVEVDAGHPITALHEPGEQFDFSVEVRVAAAPGEALLSAGGLTFLGVARVGKGRLVTWSSPAWMDTRVFGPLSGLDDLFWRGLVWAARKPFCLRGLPPLVTMRVDDVAGRGELQGETPLYWVEEATRLGWKPWLGLFIYNNSPATVRQLQAFTAAGKATVFPHAFGRPNRAPGGDYYYYEDALAYRAEDYDEFIYFDHQRCVPWSDAEVQRGLAAVDRWLAAQAPLPLSRVALAHWYEMGSNTARHIYERWGCDLTGKFTATDLPFSAGVPWLPLGPFRRYEPVGDAFPHSSAGRNKRPVYYADFLNLDGCRFFTSVTEIRDIAGYEWAPDNDVEASISRGVRTLRRALDSMALASLFTHETDYLWKITPDNLRAIMEGVTRGIAAYQPRLVTLDEGMSILRASVASRLTRVSAAPTGEITARLSQPGDCATTLEYFGDDRLERRQIEIPAGVEEMRFSL